MAKYEIVFKKSVLKELIKLPKQDVQRIIKCINELGINPRPVGAEKLSGHDKYRIRQGNYRIVYSITDALLKVWIVKIAHRKEVYRAL